MAQRLAAGQRGDVVVLARTTNGLRTVALACVEPGVRISAPDRVFEPRGGREAVEAYLRLCSSPGEARPDDVFVVLRTPGRGLPLDGEGPVAAALQAGASFTEALVGSERLIKAGLVLDRLSQINAAPSFVRELRRRGGLDKHFEEADRTLGDVEQVALEQLEQEAMGKSVAEYARFLERRTDALRKLRDDEHGIELTTVHGSKGRQWPEVIVFGVEAGQLPHRLAIAEDAALAPGAVPTGLEGERRIAYVAFTRAQERLHVMTSTGMVSQFLYEAGLLQPPKPPEAAAWIAQARATRRTAPPGRQTGRPDRVVPMHARPARRPQRPAPGHHRWGNLAITRGDFPRSLTASGEAVLVRRNSLGLVPRTRLNAVLKAKASA